MEPETRNQMIDRLPPHAPEMERAVLGCCLLDPNKCVPQIVEYFRGEEVFYDVRHQIILRALVNMHAEDVPVDALTLERRLLDTQRLEEAGGMAYVATLPDAAPSALNLPQYLEVCWEKYLARTLVATSAQLVGQVYQWNGLSEGLWAQVGRRWEEWQAKAQRHTGLPPKELVAPSEFAEAVHNLVFHVHKEAPGRHLPFELGDFRVRDSELTILAGDSETGKSTWLSEVCLHLAQQGGKVVVASMEMPIPKTLWLMCRQLLGTKDVPDCDAGRKQLAEALAWVQSRFRLFNFLGITDWRGLLDVFVYAREKLGFDTFVIDNLGMIGIAEDDLDQQGAAAAQFATFAHRRGPHVFGVHHVTKGDGNFKQRVRGSKRWTDYADNAIEWMRNEKKGDQLAEAWAAKIAGEISEEEWKRKHDDLVVKWDARCILRKQRWGERMNAARYLWFDAPSRQFRTEQQDSPVKWLEQWKAKKKTEGE